MIACRNQVRTARSLKTNGICNMRTVVPYDCPPAIAMCPDLVARNDRSDIDHAALRQDQCPGRKAREPSANNIDWFDG